MEEDHHLIIAKHFKELFLQNIEDFLGISLEVTGTKEEENKAFQYEDHVSIYIDLNGSIIGFLGITMKESTAAALLNTEASNENRNEYSPLLRELLNVIGGTIINSISAVHPLVTLTSPRIIYGSVDFPQTRSASICMQTQVGEVELFYATDAMSLKVIELLDKIKEQKGKIEQSKKEMSLILDNVPSALLTFDLKGKIGSEYSKTAETIFGSLLKSRTISSLLFQTNKKVKSFDNIIQLLPTASLPFEDLIRLAPDQDTLYFNEQKYQLQYKFIPIYKSEDEEDLLRIMVIAEDITKKIELQEEARRREEKAEFIHKVLKNRDGYLEFLREINECMGLLGKSLDNLNSDNINNAFRAGHTIKGNASIYGIRELRDGAHSLESLLMEIRDGEVSLENKNIERVRRNFANLMQAFDKHIKDSELMFGDDFDPRHQAERKYIIKESNLSKLIKLTDNPAMLNELERIRLKRIYIYLAAYEDLVYNLSKKLGKKIHALNIIGSETLIDPDRWKAFFASFVHLIRNCVDHGIEDFKERLESGKPETATISIGIVESDKGITITVSDDGRGIDPNKVSSSAIIKGLISDKEATQMSDIDKQMLIFKPGFSTKDEVTNISGRGIGMDAVLYEIKRMNGDITLKSEIGKGTNFIIEIPYLDHDTHEQDTSVENQRIFSRVDLPIYLPAKLDNGTPIGQIVNISPDGFRLVTTEENISDDEIILEIELPADLFEENLVKLKAKPMNSNTVKKNHTEWGCMIISFSDDKDQRQYESYLRTLYV